MSDSINRQVLMGSLVLSDKTAEICKGVSCPECSFNKGEDGCLLANRLDEIEITPEPQWIPCSVVLPEEKDAGILKKLGTEKKSEYVLATVEVKGERTTVIACTYDGKWDWNMKYAFPDYKVVAWMPRPEPYKEDDYVD